MRLAYRYNRIINSLKDCELILKLKVVFYRDGGARRDLQAIR